MRRFLLDGDEIVVSLPRVERELLAQLLPQLRELLMGPGDPVLRRLNPPARPDDPEAEERYRELVDDDLLLARLENLEMVEGGLDGARLDDEGVSAWLRSLNGLRLVLAERLAAEGVDLVAFDADALDDDGELGPLGHLYEWMGWMLSDLLDAAAPTLAD